MKIAHRQINGFDVVSLQGEFLAEPDQTQFREKVKAIVDRGAKHVVVDLSGVKHINSCGLGSLVCAMVMLRRVSGEIRYTGLNKDVANLLEITHLNRVFEIYPAVKDATVGKFAYHN